MCFFPTRHRSRYGNIVKVDAVERGVVPHPARAVIPDRGTNSGTRIEQIQVLTKPDEPSLLDEIDS